MYGIHVNPTGGRVWGIVLKWRGDSSPECVRYLIYHSNHLHYSLGTLCMYWQSLPHWRRSMPTHLRLSVSHSAETTTDTVGSSLMVIVRTHTPHADSVHVVCAVHEWNSCNSPHRMHLLWSHMREAHTHTHMQQVHGCACSFPLTYASYH